MTTAILGLVFDAIVAILLAVTIGFCWKLQQRIRILQESRGELAILMEQFNASTERAKSSILDIQSASRMITESMQTKLEKANYLADDLSDMIEKAGKLTGQNELARKEAVRTPAPIGRVTEANIAPSSNTAANPAKPPRSKAEQELLDALKSIR